MTEDGPLLLHFASLDLNQYENVKQAKTLSIRNELVDVVGVERKGVV